MIRVCDKNGAIKVEKLFPRNKLIRFLKPYRFVAPNLSCTQINKMSESTLVKLTHIAAKYQDSNNRHF
jgi:hypothetical protein